MKDLLIFSYSGDAHVQAVRSHLDIIGAKYSLFNTNEIPKAHYITFSSKSMDFIVYNKQCKGEFAVDGSWNIWNRRILKLDFGDPIPDGLAKVIDTETRKTLEGLMFSHSGKVINDPRDNYKAQNKLDQLKVAKDLGKDVIVPPTIVSNNPREIRQFYEENDGRVCFKLQKGEIIDLEGKKFTVMTNLVREEHLRDTELLEQCPHLFQKYFSKEYEVRVTTIGDKSIGTAIHSQESEVSKIDYRRYDFNVPYKNINLPENVAEFCRAMLNHYGLDFGAFDFIVSKDGQYIFLELNPNGQWLWLEQLSGFKISEVLAEYLVS